MEPGAFQAALKQWTHFPQELDVSLAKAKQTETFSIGGRAINVVATDTKLSFLHKIIKIEDISPKDVRKLMRVTYALQNSETQELVKNLGVKKFLGESSAHLLAKEFCQTCLQGKDKFEEAQLISFLKAFLQAKGLDAPQKREQFASSLAMESPALLYYVIPQLKLPDEAKLKAVKLAIANPISNGLDAKIQKQFLCSLSIVQFFERFRVRANVRDNIRGLLGYMVLQMSAIKELQPVDADHFPLHDLRFLHYANGVFKHGIICRERAQTVGILQVSSLDKNLRDPREVELNCVQTLEGIRVAIYHKAKGAITVATERREDPLVDKVIYQEHRIGEYLYRVPEKVENADALRILSERTHSCMLIIANAKQLKFYDNQGRELAPNAPLSANFQNDCKIESKEGCLEVKILSNLLSTSFKAILVPKRYEKYAAYLASPLGVCMEFVETKQSLDLNAKVFYGFRDARDEAKAVLVNIPVPDFEAALKRIANNIMDEGGIVITHITKGQSKDDEKR